MKAIEENVYSEGKEIGANGEKNIIGEIGGNKIMRIKGAYTLRAKRRGIHIQAERRDLSIWRTFKCIPAAERCKN